MYLKGTKEQNASATSFLFSFVASFVVFDVLVFSLNWIFTLIAFEKKRNAVLMQTGVRRLAGRKQVTLLYIELTISFLIGRKRTVNFRNQRP